MLNREDVYERTYQKIQDLTATIGGVSNVIFFLGQVINVLYHDFVLINDFNREIGCKVRKSSCDSANSCNTSLSCCVLKEKNSSTVNKIEPVVYKSSQEAKNKELSVNDSKTPISVNGLGQLKKAMKYISIWKVLNFNVRKNDNCYLKQLSDLRKKILGKERMYKYYFSLKNIKNSMMKRNSVSEKT